MRIYASRILIEANFSSDKKERASKLMMKKTFRDEKNLLNELSIIRVR